MFDRLIVKLARVLGMLFEIHTMVEMAMCGPSKILNLELLSRC